MRGRWLAGRWRPNGRQPETQSTWCKCLAALQVAKGRAQGQAEHTGGDWEQQGGTGRCPPWRIEVSVDGAIG